ncbi:methyltransferase [Kitasatospora sp. NPDC085895]|uniref:class I SAM-dependent methyltransferase n=1 Tax=Kitasatospora sp. NPDC085895 TaxID=3155057 RepID=UPI00344ECAAD
MPTAPIAAPAPGPARSAVTGSDPAGSDPACGAAAEFVRSQTALGAVPFVPEVRLHLAEEAIGLWERTESAKGEVGLPPPFWGFAWAGGQAVARYVLDHPETVAGRAVLDLAAGSGLVGIACALRGAASVTAAEIDAYAVAATGLNAAANGVRIDARCADLLPGDGSPAEVVLAGDVFYERAMAHRVLPFLRRARARGALVLVGDPGRAYLPREHFTEVASYRVPVVADLEDAPEKTSVVWRLDG